MRTLPALCEDSILKRHSYSLQLWWIQEDPDGALRAHGESYDKLKPSAPLAFVDTDNQVVLDTDGTSWHLSAHQCATYMERVPDWGPSELTKSWANHFSSHQYCVQEEDLRTLLTDHGSDAYKKLVRNAKVGPLI
jgi:hypothetical protein